MAAQKSQSTKTMKDINKIVKLTSKTIKETTERIGKIKEEAQQQMAKQFREVFDQLFDAYPQLQSICWTQYTPYFNDGEECVFEAHTDYPTINGYSEYGELNQEAIDALIAHDVDTENPPVDLLSLARDEQWDDTKKKFVKKTLDPLAKEIVKNIQTILRAIDRETLKDAFGDHCMVIITKGRTIVEEYEHD